MCTWEQARDKSGSSSRNEIYSVRLDILLNVKDGLEILGPLKIFKLEILRHLVQFCNVYDNGLSRLWFC